MSERPPMTPTTASTNSDSSKYDIEDGVVLNETLVISPINSLENRRGDEKIWNRDGPDEPTEVIVRDPGPLDGGYGWVVVAYVLLLRIVLMIGLFLC